MIKEKLKQLKDKNKLTLMVTLIVIVLILVVIGSTYAYFKCKW